MKKYKLIAGLAIVALVAAVATVEATPVAVAAFPPTPTPPPTPATASVIITDEQAQPIINSVTAVVAKPTSKADAKPNRILLVQMPDGKWRVAYGFPESQ